MDLRKLDHLVATEIMGWRRMSYAELQPDNKYYAERSDLDSYWHDSNNKETARATPSDCIDCGTDFPEWSPSTDIAAAWLVVEKVAGMDLSGPMPNGTWWCQINHSIPPVRGTSAPLAICLSALKAKGIDVSEWEK